MTITTPPNVRSRRSRRLADAASPDNAARRGPARPATADAVDGLDAVADAVVGASARGGGDRERATTRRGSGEAATRPDRSPAGRADAKAARRGTGRGGERGGERPAARRGGTAARTPEAAGVKDRSGRTVGGAPAAGTTGRTATAPAAPRRTARPATARPAAAPRARAPFVLVVVGLLGGALVSLLLLNTVLAQDAFTLSELQQNNRQLNERRQALQEDIARESSPEVLHRKALGLGMKDSGRPAFIDARTGRVTEGGVRPQGVPDDVVAAAAAGAVTGAPGVIAPPAGGTPVRPGAGKEGGGR